MKKILKICKPSIRAYLGDAFCFSIIDDYAFDSGWVYDKYIHLEYTPCDGQVKYADYDYYDFVPDQGVFVKSFIEYPSDHSTQMAICRQIEQMIDHEEYCFALWDETIVRNYLFRTKESEIYEHGCFIYGYNNEERVFYTEGYLNGDKWECYTIPYHVLYNALSYCPEKGEIALVAYRLLENYSWNFNYTKMIESINCYINSSLDMAKVRNYDLGAIICFFSNLVPGKKIHYPSLYCIYEHKIILVKRIQFLARQGSTELNDLLVRAKKLEQASRSVMILGISYNISLNTDMFTTMFDEVKEMIKVEKELLFIANTKLTEK